MVKRKLNYFKIIVCFAGFIVYNNHMQESRAGSSGAGDKQGGWALFWECE